MHSGKEKENQKDVVLWEHQRWQAMFTLQYLDSWTIGLMCKSKYSFLKLNFTYKGQIIIASEKQISFQRIEDVIITCNPKGIRNMKNILYSILSRFKFSTCQVLLMRLVKKKRRRKVVTDRGCSVTRMENPDFSGWILHTGCEFSHKRKSDEFVKASKQM